MKRQESWRHNRGVWNCSGRVEDLIRGRQKFNQIKSIKRANRQGVSVFVNFVSKRIRPATLREAFQDYGKVTDVYITYHNPRRRRLSSTFAFVRFSNMWEALNAVDLANNRRMDEFTITIKVFLEHKSSGDSKGPLEEVKKPTRTSQVSVDLAKGRDERSYKEVLLCKKKENLVELTDKRHTKSFFKVPDNKGREGNSSMMDVLVIKDVHNGWLKNCLVGQVSAMYDHSFIQQVLQSEGFKVKVSCWSGVYSIIKFEEVEQLEIFWDLKDSLLNSWFCDIESVETFLQRKKLRVWACIKGLPLEVWNESSLVSIGSQWGNVKLKLGSQIP
ncbi:hypothetical protein V6N13_004179 [Hibiscus sabdariffa]